MKKGRKSAAAVLLACGILSLGMSEDRISAATQTEEETGSTTERRAEIMIVSIIGNELTYYEVETETDETEDADEENSAGTDQKTESSEEQETELTDSLDQETEGAADEDETVRSSTQMNDSENGPQMGDGGGGNGPQTGDGGSGNGPQTEDRESSQNLTEDAESSDQAQEYSRADSDENNSGGMTDFNGGESPQGDFGNMPDFEGGNMPQGEMPGRGSSGESGESGSSERSDMKMGHGFSAQSYTTVYLQVGVPVHTDQEEDSTFTILQDGDQVEVLFVTDEESGEEVITEIWME